jgi:hypothetical protein
MEKWMEQNWETWGLGEKRISEIWLPGSHDAATDDLSLQYRNSDMDDELLYHLQQPVYRTCSCFILAFIRRWATTQHSSVLSQLNAGSRYLDLRPVVTDAGDILCTHALLGKRPFKGILTDIHVFLGANPKEFLILDLHCLRAALSLTQNDMERIESVIFETLNNFIIPESSWDCPLNVLLEKNVRIFVVMEKDDNARNFHARHGTAKVRRVWHNTHDIGILKEKIEEEIQYRATQDEQPRLVHILSFLRTPPDGGNAGCFYVMGIISFFFCCLRRWFPSSLAELNNDIKQQSPSWINEWKHLYYSRNNLILRNMQAANQICNEDEHICITIKDAEKPKMYRSSVMMMDFVTENRELVMSVIELNALGLRLNLN